MPGTKESMMGSESAKEDAIVSKNIIKMHLRTHLRSVDHILKHFLNFTQVQQPAGTGSAPAEAPKLPVVSPAIEVRSDSEKEAEKPKGNDP